MKLKRIGFYVTLRCNLRCKYCASYVSYYSNPWHPEINDLYRQIDRLFELISYVGTILITGGEPFLRDDIDLLFQYFEKYSDKIGLVEVVTNGTIFPNDKFFDALRNKHINIKITINNYEDISCYTKLILNELNTRCSNVKIKLRDAANISYSWVNYNLKDKRRATEEVQNIYNKCHLPNQMGWDFYMYNGILYRCPQIKRAIEIGLVMPSNAEIIDIFDNSCSNNELKVRMIHSLTLPYFTACNFCDGQSDDSMWHKPAEQL